MLLLRRETGDASFEFWIAWVNKLSGQITEVLHVQYLLVELQKASFLPYFV